MIPAKVNRFIRVVRERRTRKARLPSDSFIFDRATRFLLKRIGKPHYEVIIASRGFIGHLPELVRPRAREILSDVMSSLFVLDDLGRLAAK